LEGFVHDDKQASKGKNRTCEFFTKGAVEMAARKVSATTGDLRRALQLCIRAVEIWKVDAKNMSLQISHVVKASRQLEDGQHLHLIKDLPLYEKLLFVAVVLQLRVQKNNSSDANAGDSVMFSSICERYEEIVKRYSNIHSSSREQRKATKDGHCNFTEAHSFLSKSSAMHVQITVPNRRQMFAYAQSLGKSSLVKITHPNDQFWCPQIRIAVPLQEVSFLFEKDPDTQDFF
jgi:hypothetical protein